MTQFNLQQELEKINAHTQKPQSKKLNVQQDLFSGVEIIQDNTIQMNTQDIVLTNQNQVNTDDNQNVNSLDMNLQYCCRYLLEKGSISLTQNNVKLYNLFLKHKDQIINIFKHFFKRVEYKNGRIIVYDDLKDSNFWDNEENVNFMLQFPTVGKQKRLNINDGYLLLFLTDLYIKETQQQGSTRVFVTKSELIQVIKDFTNLEDGKKVNDIFSNSLNKFLDYRLIIKTDIDERFEICKIIEDIVNEDFMAHIKQSLCDIINEVSQ